MTPGFVGATGQARPGNGGNFVSGPTAVGTVPGLIRTMSSTTPPVTDQLTAHYAARLESFADGDAVATLSDQQNTNDLTQATSSKKPTFRDNGTDNIGGHPVVEFDGSDDLLIASNFLTSTSGDVFVVVNADSGGLGNGVSVLSSEDEATDNINFVLLSTRSGPSLATQQKNNDTQDIVEGDTTLSSGTDYIWENASSGTAYRLTVNGTDQTLTVALGSDSGDWFGDSSSRDNVVLGANKDSSGEEAHWDGRIAEVLIYSKELSASERTDIENWLNDTVGYGIF